jgi:hypothetical protein
MAPFSGVPQPLSDSIDIYLLRVLLPRESSRADLVRLRRDVFGVGMLSRRPSPEGRDDNEFAIGQVGYWFIRGRTSLLFAFIHSEFPSYSLTGALSSVPSFSTSAVFGRS